MRSCRQLVLARTGTPRFRLRCLALRSRSSLETRKPRAPLSKPMHSRRPRLQAWTRSSSTIRSARSSATRKASPSAWLKASGTWSARWSKTVRSSCATSKRRQMLPHHLPLPVLSSHPALGTPSQRLTVRTNCCASLGGQDGVLAQQRPHSWPFDGAHLRRLADDRPTSRRRFLLRHVHRARGLWYSTLRFGGRLQISRREVSMPPPLHGTLPHAPCAVRSTCMRLQTVRARPSGPTPTIFCYCFVYRIKNQIAKKGHSMTNRIEVTKDQALEVSCRCARLLQRCRGF